MNINERTYNKLESVIFRSTKERYGGLSNMAAGYSIRVNEIIIPSSEALYQACRFPLFPKIQQEIIEQHSPMTAKMISRKYKNCTRQDWDVVKYKVMYWALKVKLSQNYNSFSKLLISTGEKPIVELSRNDKDWAAVETAPNILTGKNALGRLLMQLREEYVFQNSKIDCVPPLDITGFMLYGSEIDSVCQPEFEFDNNILFDVDYV